MKEVVRGFITAAMCALMLAAIICSHPSFIDYKDNLVTSSSRITQLSSVADAGVPSSTWPTTPDTNLVFSQSTPGPVATLNGVAQRGLR